MGGHLVVLQVEPLLQTLRKALEPLGQIAVDRLLHGLGQKLQVVAHRCVHLGGLALAGIGQLEQAAQPVVVGRHPRQQPRGAELRGMVVRRRHAGKPNPFGGHGADGASPPRAWQRCRVTTPRPTRAQLLTAADREIPDRVRPGLPLIICGINPGLWSGYTGHHFAGPANRLWPALERAGITPRRLRADEGDELLELGVGITNMVMRTTATAAEVGRDELRLGGRRLESVVAAVRPGALAVLGMGAFRVAFDRPKAQLGRQPEPVCGVAVWLLPNPSGLQARYGVDVIAGLLAEAYSHGVSELRERGL